MSDVGCSCIEAQVTAHIPLRRIRSGIDCGNGSLKTIERGKVGKVLYHYAAAYPISTFSTSSSSSFLASPNLPQHSPPPPNPNQIWEMAPKKGAVKPKKTIPKKASTGARRDEEWVPS